MKATILTLEQLRNDNGRKYNPRVWNENIDSYLKNNSNVEFYKVKKGNGYDYERYYVSYTLPEGLRLFNKFGYSYKLTDGNFVQVLITDFCLKTFTLFENNQVEITTITRDFKINNSKEHRNLMIEKSNKYGFRFTKENI